MLAPILVYSVTQLSPEVGMKWQCERLTDRLDIFIPLSNVLLMGRQVTVNKEKRRRLKLE